MGDTFKNPYDILGIPHASDIELVKNTWKELVKKYHPDVYEGDDEHIAEINAAYEILKNPEEKQMLDEKSNSTFDDDEYQDFNSTQSSNKSGGNYPFWWFDDKDKLHVRYTKLCAFLEESGFYNFSDNGDRTAEPVIIRTVEGYVQLYNQKSVKNFLLNYIKTDENISSKEPILDYFIKLNPKTLGTWIESLSTYSMKSNEDCQSIDILTDNKDECFVPFKNGVVKISKSNIQLLSKDALKDEGKIWETAVIDHSIDVSEVKILTSRNYFKEFITYAMKKEINPKHVGNDLNEGTDTDEHKSSMAAVETAFGYMLHTYIHPTKSKAIIFIDSGASSGIANGGNGKSLVMKAVEHFKNCVEIDGGNWKSDKSFNLMSVKRDTQFVIISDIKSDFNLKNLYNHITDEFSVEGKGTNSWSFPKDKKPKMGITTNYIVGGLGSSDRRRMFPVEFGDFFKRGLDQKPEIQPDTVLGLMLFEEFSEDDWNTFYNYGFTCIQKYLNEGLIPQDSTDLQLKMLIKEIEGASGDGVLVKWIANWIDTDRISGAYHKNGIPIDQLWSSFAKEYPSHADKQWTQPRFKKSLFDYVSYVPELDYNPQLAHNGNGMSDRKWRQGSRGDQVEWVKITHIDDVKSNDDEIVELFAKLAS